ncbi:ATP-binding cassette domain-containing protein [Paenibacillus sp. Marseille-Q4541]|uniref:ABC transporter ATP-binding protein n=1 Tax=Paenibacillus sp. Marseille-Q4541 TaxID=2831522 RepID=UPI001BAC05B9|nr:ATP-binding cassette domain-containing protein [Paenibacillus sp. Marseille-Q4541]
MNNEGLTMRSISKSFGKFTALHEVDVTIPKGKLTCLLGPSGCGKTTLLRIIAGLENPDTGSIMMEKIEITELPPAKRNFGIVFQSYALFPNLNVQDNIAYGLKGKLPRKQIVSKVKEMLELVGLQGIEERYPAQLSGGQQQRVALARAIALSPEVLLLDEPLSALDAKVREKLRLDLCELQQRLGMTMVMVTHDQEEALTMADQIIVMDHGHVMQSGTPQEVYDRPSSPFVADFIGAINFIPTELSGLKAKGQRMIAIRPEYLQMVSHNDDVTGTREDYIKGYVKHVEFRGAFYRISLQLADGQGQATHHQVWVDITSETAHNIRFSEDSLLKFRLPEERILEYDAKSFH